MDGLALTLLTMGLGVAAIVACARRARWRRKRGETAGQVHRQHLYLFQGGHLGESQVESSRRTFERMLSRGDVREVEQMIQAGTKFAAQIRALTEIGSDAAGVILERQLDRRHSSDPLEQSWYWLDVACALRSLARTNCLPALMRRVGERGTTLSHFLAAETVCFPGFIRQLEQPESAAGRAAMRTLIAALTGLRTGVQPHVVVVGRLGDAVETVWDHRREPADPLAVRIFAEALRLLRRADHAERLFGDNEAERQMFRRQVERIGDRAEVFRDYLHEAAASLLDSLAQSPADEQADRLHALIDLRADTARVVIPLFEGKRLVEKELAVESLAYSRHSSVAPFLLRAIERELRANRGGFPVRTALQVLRHQPSEKSELALLHACVERKAEIRIAALGSLGWWEPIHREAVLACLKEARYNGHPAIFHAAQAALARLGERHALRWFRHQLLGETNDSVHRTIQRIAEEGILLLWPDVDALADADDRDVAFHACDALEQLREDCVPAIAGR
jgi:hypothetical protein